MPVSAQLADADQKERKAGPKLRLICISSLVEDQEVVLASRDDQGNWKERATVDLRSPFITDWLPAAAGKLHLALREEGTLKSICQFTYPASARRALVLLVPDKQKKAYRANVIDPEELKFSKGSVLIANFSKQEGIVLLGSRKVPFNPGQRVVAKPGLDANGMYRILVACYDDQKNPVPCFDAYFSGDTDLRKMLFLFPDPNRGLRVFSLPMFGELE